MNKSYNSLCLLLGVETIALTDGSASLTDEQLTAINSALEMKAQVIADLEAQVAELKAAPAASSTAVVDDSKAAAGGNAKNEFEQFCDNVNAARKLYDSL